MIYVYLSLFILSLLGLVYTFYSLEINRKLNIKKRLFAIRPSRNKFYIIFCINVLLIITFGSLFVFKLVYRPKVPVIPVEEKENYGKPIDKTTPVTILNNNIEYHDYDISKSYRNNYYYYLDGVLYCYDTKKEETISKEIPSSNFLVVKNKVVVYYETNEESIDKTHIEIYDGSLLRLEKEIVIDAKLKECFGSSSIFLGSFINIVGESFNVKEIDKIGFVETDYSYEEVDEDVKVTKLEKEKICIRGVLSPQYHNYDRVVIHLQYNISSDAIKVNAICLSDYYLTNVEGYFYFFCNAYEKDSYSNESFILKYNPFDLSISNYHMYSNIIYSSPIVYSEGITTYLSFVMYNSAYQSYQLVTIDNDLVIVDVKDTYIDTKEREYESDSKNKLIFDNKIITVNNILSFDNNCLINYEVNAEEKKIIVNEFKLADLTIDKYVLVMTNDFTTAKINDILKSDDKYFLIYEVDGKQGIAYYPIYQEEEIEENKNAEGKEVKVNEVIINVGEVSNNEYFIISGDLLTIGKDDEDNTVITIEKIENIMKEESGE